MKKNAEVPRISKIFAILDPIIFPVMASVAGTIFVAANRVITSSGADVPNATIVKPINTGDKLKIYIRLPKLSTVRSSSEADRRETDTRNKNK